MELKHYLNLIHRTTCLNCGSLWTLSGCLCRPCAQHLHDQQRPDLLKTRHTFGAVLSLFEWSPGESDMLSRLIVWLKGPYQKLPWRHYAELFAAKRLALEIPERRLHIVIPPYGKGRLHALFWAESLAQILGAQLHQPFQAENLGKQKELSREERSKRAFVLAEEFTQILTDSREDLWVFADDVFTTGSTAKAAFLALKSPPHFEVWCLGQRAALLRSLAESVIKAE